MFFEQTRVITVKDGESKEVITDQGSIMAKKVVIATHLPVYDPDSLNKHLTPARSYVLGLFITGDFPDGMFIDIDPMHTYRTTPTEEGKLIIVAGEHSPVDVDDRNVYYSHLERYAREHLNINSVEYQWTSIDVVSDDGLPIIGMTSKKDIYLATGLGFWGMVNGMTAAMIITDLINNKENTYASLFDPLRF